MPTSRNIVMRLWHRVQEPRVTHALQCAMYLALAVVGAVAVWAPPTTIQEWLGVGLAQVWGLLLLAGGAASALSVLPGVWWVERLGLIACLTAAAMYLVVVAHLEVTGTGSFVAHLGVTIVATLALIQRAVVIRGYPFDPERR